MKKTTLIVVVILAIACGGLLIFRNKEEVEIGDKTFKIGVISTLTGSAAYYGQSTMKGAEAGLAVAKEKFPDLDLQLIHQDSLFTPKGGIDAYNKLRSTNNIDAVITQASNVGVAVQPLALRDGILQISASVLANNYSTPHDLSFRLTAKADDEITPIITYFKENNIKKVAIFGMNNEIGVSLSDSIEKEALSAGIEIITKESFPPDTTDFKTQLAKVARLNPEAIYLGTISAQTAQILKQADEFGIKGPFFSYRAAEDPTLIKNAPTLASRIIYTNAYDSLSDNQQTKDFIAAWNDKYDEAPNGYAAEAYEAVLLAAEAFDACNKNYVCIQKHLENTKNKPSVFGPLSFDENGDVTYGLFLKTVKDGGFVRLEK
jgi:branched-chain amino acid transport system substrate-binding protein